MVNYMYFRFIGPYVALLMVERANNLRGEPLFTQARQGFLNFAGDRLAYLLAHLDSVLTGSLAVTSSCFACVILSLGWPDPITGFSLDPATSDFSRRFRRVLSNFVIVLVLHILQSFVALLSSFLRDGPISLSLSIPDSSPSI